MIGAQAAKSVASAQQDRGNGKFPKGICAQVGKPYSSPLKIGHFTRPTTWNAREGVSNREDCSGLIQQSSQLLPQTPQHTGLGDIDGSLADAELAADFGGRFATDDMLPA